ncbi:MAG: hypothetical protein CL570_00385 [Alphaproteobacteria bacterium]|nr:hypothetical protein [Alphaproteobacteria bacterium]
MIPVEGLTDQASVWQHIRKRWAVYALICFFAVGLLVDGVNKGQTVTNSSGSLQKSTVAEDKVDYGEFILLCKKAVLAVANHPSTVKYAIIGARHYNLGEDGVGIKTTFKAKNSFGLEIKNEVACLFENGALTDIRIQEIE